MVLDELWLSLPKLLRSKELYLDEVFLETLFDAGSKKITSTTKSNQPE